MEPIFSPQGNVIAWLHNDYIHDELGEPRAAIRNGRVFAFDSAYLGRLDRFYFRDLHGDAVAYMVGASGRPLVPTPCVVPKPPSPRAVLITPSIRVVPQEAPASEFWSEMDWATFLQPAISPEA
jgi:hypothetical protein